MSIDSVKQLVAKAGNDVDLQADLQATEGDKDKLISVARNYGFSITASDIDAYRDSAELDEDALDKVAGGGSGGGGINIAWSLICVHAGGAD